MKHVKVLLHAFLALVPVLVGRWIVREVAESSGATEFFAYNCSLVFVLLAGVGLGSFVPQLWLVACRNAGHSSMDEYRRPVPVHPVGWITVIGVWGHLPALWIASRLSGEVYPVSFSFLGPPLILASFILSRRWVEGTLPAPAGRAAVGWPGSDRP